MIKSFRVFYNENHKIISVSENSDEIITEEKETRDLQNYNYFEVMKGYKKTHDDLLRFKKDFIQWRNELLKYKINYSDYFNSANATFFNFRRFTTNIFKRSKIKGYENIEDIKLFEFLHFEKCFNGGLMTINKDFLNIEQEYFGFDFSSYYPNLISNSKFEFPVRTGKLSKISDFKNKLKYGIYHCKIICNNKQFNQIFAYSSENHYTHYCLNFCLKYKERFNIKLELFVDDDFNCLIYETKDIIKSSSIFNEWFEKLNKIKSENPKNKLIKQLSSSIIGTLTQFNRQVIKSEEELNNLDISELLDEDETEYKLLSLEPSKNSYSIKVIPTNQPYKHNMARIKSFFSSFARVYMAKFIIENNILDNTVRILTDGILLNKNFDFSNLEYYPKPETDKNGSYILKSITTDTRIKNK